MKTSIELPSGVKISISARLVGVIEQDKWKQPNVHYKVKVVSDRTDIHPLLKPTSHTYDHWCYNEHWQERDLLESVCELFSSACLYDANRDFEDFVEATGYDEESAVDIYRDCKKSHKACERLFGRFYGSIHNDLEEYINQFCNE